MATHIPAPKTYIYKEVNKGKYRTVKHYQSVTPNDRENLLSNLLNISKDRQCAKSSPKYWLQLHNGKKWVKPRVTGLFETSRENLFKGDIDKRKHLVLFAFSSDKSFLIIHVFKNYYTTDLRAVLPLIKQ